MRRSQLHLTSASVLTCQDMSNVTAVNILIPPVAVQSQILKKCIVPTLSPQFSTSTTTGIPSNRRHTDVKTVPWLIGGTLLVAFIFLVIGAAVRYAVRMPQQSRKRGPEQYESTPLIDTVEVDLDVDAWTPKHALDTLQQSYQSPRIPDVRLAQQATLFLFQDATRSAQASGHFQESRLRTASPKSSALQCRVCSGPVRSKIGQ